MNPTRGRKAVCFLLHFPWPHGRWVLPITASHGARTFLSPSVQTARMAAAVNAQPAVIQSTPDRFLL